MAVDTWLLDRARRTGESVFRTYQWLRPTLSLGRNQTAAGRYRREALARHNIQVVRRPTGGRAILHWRELTYSVTAPTSGLDSLQADYGRINSVIVLALETLGARPEVVSGGGRTRKPDLQPCFAEPSAGEVVVRAGDRTGKVVGSAQYREEGALLQHGSILLHDDQPLLVELAGDDAGQTYSLALSEVLGRDVSPVEVTTALFDAVRDRLDRAAAPLDFAGIPEAASVYEGHFADSLWTWRR
jgi:lipoyl(octanoyl) transferase